jgi:hypothetical protein
MASIQDTDLLLINRGGADYQAQVSELPPGPSGTPNGGTGDRPSSPEIGDLYFDTDLDLLIVWNGTSWEPVSPPQDPDQWTRTGTTLAPTNPGDTVAVTAADGTENISLNADGSAQFADAATCKRLVVATTSDTDGQVVASFYGFGGNSRGLEVKLGKSGAVANALVTLDAKQSVEGILAFATKGVERMRVDDVRVAIGGTLPSAPNITLKADGSATFAGSVTADNVTFNLEADDDTKYTATTNEEGEQTLVYNGATLDMKEVGLALVALKSAAAAASDFTTLKSAIATALANLS